MEEIIKRLEQFYLRVQSLLEKEHAQISQCSKYADVKLETKTGLVHLKSGLLVPSTVVSHRVFYESYESMFLNTFLNLSKAMIRNKKEVFLPFAYRTVFELGIRNADVLFSNEISADDKKRVRFLSTLADYSSLNQAQYRKHFKKLYEEEKHSLSDTDKELLEVALDKATPDIALIKKIRKHYSQAVSRLHAKVVPLSFGNHNSEMAIYSWYSHMLHGNLLLIDDTVTREYSWRNVFWVHGILIHAGQNLAARVAEYLGIDQQKLKLESYEMS